MASFSVVRPSSNGIRPASPETRNGVTAITITALGYVRRSKESGERTVSLEDQRERIAGYCREHCWRLAETLADDGVSGGRRERLERLDGRLKATRATVVVVYHLDRFARDAAALLDWLERAERRGVELHVVGRGRVEARSASGYLMAGVEGVVAGHYRKLVSEKTRDALGRLCRTGRRYSGLAPYGYSFGPGGQLVPEPGEQSTLDQIGALRVAGLSLRAIARALAGRGLLARNGRVFAPMTLSRLVTDRPVGDSRGPE